MQRDRTGSAGAMTLAMKAVSAHDAKRVLRVGWIEGARLRDERVFRDPTEVSVGRNERSTFVVADEIAPSRFTLFQPEGSGYRLFFTDSMEGRVARPEGVVTLSSLRESGRARREREGWSIALDPQSRGKISVGATSILFQFVPAPPPSPRPQLPVAIRARPLARTDWTYNACLSGFLFLAFGAVSYVEYGYDPVIEESFEEAANNVRLVMPPADESPPPPAPVATPTDSPPDHREAMNDRRNDTPRPSNDTHRDAPHSSNTPANAAANAEAAMVAAGHAADLVINGFARSSEFHALTGMQTNAAGVPDALAQGATMTGTEIDLRGTTGVESGDHGIHRNSLVASNEFGNSNQLGRTGPVHSSGPGVSTGNDQQIVLRAPMGHVTPQAPEQLTGDDINMESVAAVVRRNLGGVQWCYTQGIRNHPSLQGRIEVHFSIGTSGRITGTPDLRGFEEAPEVRQCIQNRFRSMVFPQPTGGAVEVSFPFQFVPGT